MEVGGARADDEVDGASGRRSTGGARLPARGGVPTGERGRVGMGTRES